MKLMKLPLIVILGSVVFLIGNTAQAGEKRVSFSAKLIAVDANEGCAIVDVNNDGKLDLVAGRNWYAAPDFVPRALRPIEDRNGYIHSNGDFPYDVDGDG